MDKAGKVPAPFFPLRAVGPTIYLHLSSTPFIIGSRLLKQDSSGTDCPWRWEGHEVRLTGIDRDVLQLKFGTGDKGFGSLPGRERFLVYISSTPSFRSSVFSP